MNSEKLIRKIISFILAWLIIFNYCDLSFLNGIINVKNAEAAETLNVANLWAEKRDSLGWIDENNVPQTAMWADTTAMETIWIDADKAGVGTAAFAESVGLPIDEVITEAGASVSSYAYDPDITDEDIPMLYYTIAYDEVLDGYYRVYYVSTANQLMQLLTTVSINSTYVRPTAAEIKSIENYKSTNAAIKLGIKLLCDIDLGGSNDKKWIGTSNNSIYMDIDGNGNKIYNGYFIKVENGVNAAGKVQYKNYTFLANGAKYFYIHDVDFDNMCIDREGGLFGATITYSYFNNVNFEHCLAFGAGTGVSIVLGYSYLRTYFNNCMIRNSYVHGNAHCAMFSSYNGGAAFYPNNSYIGDTDPTAETFYFTDIPSSIEEVEKVWKGQTIEYEGRTYKLSSTSYPCIYKNSMAVDSEVYDTGSNHSGTFVSCMQSQIIFKNCFTNSTIYANQQSGVFIGCVIGSADGCYLNIEGEKTLVNAYFENCYSSGLIEGKTSEGGFIGGIFNDVRAYGYQNEEVAYTPYRGKAVCKDCYSTSSVGMQYSGNNVGGFVGQVYGNIRSEGTDSDKQHLFINCYVAGEVGGITTDPSILTTNTNSIGGFFGTYLKTDPDTITTKNDITFDSNQLMPLVCEGCCYDKQTTAMRERDVGNYNLTSPLNNTVDGLTGVYTLTSTQKNVAGLADTDGVMGNNDVWVYKDGYYPQLDVFTKYAEENFGNKAEIARLYSQASTATVFLDHWDTIMDASGNTVPTTDTKIYDTVRDISAKFEFTSGGNSTISNLGWQTNREKNEQKNFASYLGGVDEDGNPKGFTIDFKYMPKGGDSESTITKKYMPEVLTIQSELEANNDYSFKCFDFAEGKQFVKVTTCTNEDYKNWEEKQRIYTEYLTKADEYEIIKSNYIQLLKLDDSATEEEIQAALRTKLISNLYLDENATDEEIGNKLSRIIKLTEDFIDGDMSVKSELATLLRLNSEVSDEELSSVAMEYLQYYLYPFKAPEEVEAPVDFASYISGEFGTRTLRLIPTAYLNAGDMINVNVQMPDDSGEVTEVQNAVDITVDSVNYKMDTFDHTIGVAYSSTQGLGVSTVSTKLGEPAYYVPQVLVQNSADFYNNTTKLFNDTSLNGNTVFALYDVYPTIKNTDIGGYTEKSAGLDAPIYQSSLGDFYGNGDLSNDGLTKVDVYSTVAVGSNNSYTLEKGDKVDMTNALNLAKWSGQEKFNADDKGYYYMIYYWRLNDGRYLEEYKLVKITANEFNVGVRTGVAGAVEDSFRYGSDGKVEYTAIDCDIYTDYNNYDDLQSELKRHYFPSDLYYSQKDNMEWEEYADTAYDYYDKYLEYNDGTYWYKGVNISTASSGVCVAWRKNTDYALVKLMVEVNDGGQWVPMAIAIEDGNGNFEIDEEETPVYSYRYKSYDVVQNPKTKQFSVISTNNTVRGFKVSSTGGEGFQAGSVRYIDFQFIDTNSGQSLVEFNDDIRVTALFRLVTADVRAVETVLIDDGVSEADLVQGGSEILPLDKAEEYRSVDNTDLENADKKAVLFGDNLIFRKKIQNVGHYDGSNVVVVENIPEGLSLIDGSIKLYKQPRNINIAGEDEYMPLDEVELDISDAFQGYATKSYSYEYDEENRQITWRLNPVSMSCDYYVQFEATADEQYNVFTKNYDVQADYGYVYVNGDVDDSSALDQLNTNYGAHAIYNINSTETIDETGEISYTMEFKKQNNTDKTYYITNIYNELPDDYELIEDSVNVEFTNPSDAELFDIIKKSDTLAVKPKSNIPYILDGDNTITISYTTKPKAGVDLSSAPKNEISIQYVPESDLNTQLQNSLARITSVTNSVTADARWLYLNVEKEIANEDNEQSFLFEIAKQDAEDAVANTILTDINCVKNGDVYKGNKVIQIDARGYYDVTETDWANTDYDIDKATYSLTDIDLTNGVISGSYYDDGTKAVIQASGDKGFYLPRAMYRSTAFPLWVTEGEDNSIIYPTVICNNVESEYAWLSSQNYVENSFNMLNSKNLNNDTSSKATSELPVMPKDKTATPSAVIEESITVKKDDSEQ